MSTNSQKALAILLTILIILLGAAGLGWLHNFMRFQTATIASELGIIEETKRESPAEIKEDLKSILSKNQQLVVCLEVELGYSHSLGSGFLCNHQGDIITNAHVVGNAGGCRVKMANGMVYQGTVIGRGTDIDIALVRVPELAGKEPMKLAQNRQGEIGDEVLALGSPLGLQNTATTGIISGLNRDFHIDDFYYQGLYQISAPISQGSSGGPLLDKNTGEVLGVNTAAAKGEGIGFSIPISQALPLVEKWSQNPAPPSSSPANTVFGGDQEAFEYLAINLVYYYYYCINNGYYVDAYALLGSNWQVQEPYENFRDGYLNTLQVEIDSLTSRQDDADYVNVSIIIDALERSGSSEVISTYQASYQVGFENDKLKLLSGQANKI